jgi:hypothetical protein
VRGEAGETGSGTRGKTGCDIRRGIRAKVRGAEGATTTREATVCDRTSVAKTELVNEKDVSQENTVLSADKTQYLGDAGKGGQVSIRNRLTPSRHKRKPSNRG